MITGGESYASKLPDVGTTIFTIMSKLAADCGAINLSQGFPDFEPPDGLVSALAKRITSPGHHQYPPMHGIELLRQQIAQKIRRLYGADVNPDDEITITSGATEAIFVAIQAMVQPGDEVILFDPAYDAYDPAVRLAGGTAVHLPLISPGFEIDLARLESVLSPKTRLIVLNSPHNPTGSLIQAETLEAVVRLAERFDVFIVADEVYEHMTFDGIPHFSALASEAGKARSFVISSFGKTYHATGWKVAYCVAPKALTVEFRKVHQFVTFTTHTPSQWAIADFMVAEPLHTDHLSAFYAAKRDRFIELFSPLGFVMQPSLGTYFQLADYGGIDALKNLPDTSAAELLTREYGVAAIPLSVFYADPPDDQRLLRFCFAKHDETIAEAATRLAKGLAGAAQG